MQEVSGEVNDSGTNTGVWVSTRVQAAPQVVVGGVRICTIHPERQERELPTAALLAAEGNGAKLQWIPCRGAGIDPSPGLEGIARGRLSRCRKTREQTVMIEVEICASTI